MNFLDNITFRRNRTKSDSNSSIVNESITSTESHIDGTTTSLPDISDDEENQSNQLKKQLERLKIELKSAHINIEALSLENTNLKRINQDLLEQNEYYKNMTCSSSKRTLVKQKVDENRKSIVLGEREMNTTTTVQHNRNKQNKICIISANKTNKILAIAEEKMHDFAIYHHLTTNCGIKQQLRGIKNMLKDYSKDDFCVILIGEDDFKTTNDYFDLIYYIRNTLNEIDNTNIILCLPTFKFNSSSNLFNWRVENFANLLYLDVMTHLHAYLLDSNLHLTYDNRMFSNLTGRLNNIGMRTIFDDIKRQMQDIIAANLMNNDTTFSFCDDTYNPEQEGRSKTKGNLDDDTQFFLQHRIASTKQSTQEQSTSTDKV